MIQKIKTLLFSLSAVFIFGAQAATAPVAYAVVIQDDINKGLQAGSCGDLTGGSCDTGQAVNDLNTKIKTIINVISIIVGVVAVVMLIVGGFRYVASGGKQESVAGAKNTILYALIGLVIVAIAQLVVKFVLNKTAT